MDYVAQAKEHKTTVAAYKANSSLSHDRNQASTIGHGEYLVATFEALAGNSQELTSGWARKRPGSWLRPARNCLSEAKAASLKDSYAS